MRFFRFKTRRALKRENAELHCKVCKLEGELMFQHKAFEEIKEALDTTVTLLNKKRATYPLDLGQTVYDIQLRGENGRYTRTKASREHSIINEVVVDTKNYFKLVQRMNEEDVFTSMIDAEKKLDQICIK